MKLSKTKTYPFPIQEFKSHLRYGENETYVNDEVEVLIKDAFTQLEQDIQMDVVPTVTELEDYSIYSDCYRINQPNVVISGITGITSTGEANVVTGFSYQYFKHHTLLKFDTSLEAETLHIVYSSGSETPASSLMRAAKLLTGYYHDVDRSTIATGSHRATDAYYRLIAPFIIK